MIEEDREGRAAKKEEGGLSREKIARFREGGGKKAKENSLASVDSIESKGQESQLSIKLEAEEKVSNKRLRRAVWQEIGQSDPPPTRLALPQGRGVCDSGEKKASSSSTARS